MSHRRVGFVLGVSDVQIVKDEAKAIAKILAADIDWEQPALGHDPYSGAADNGAREASELWAILKARRLGSKARTSR